LETLVGPGQDDRAARLRAAIDIERQNPPPIVRRDVITDFAPLLAYVPKNATPVVFHTGPGLSPGDGFEWIL